jgi:F0F1-type ATP synthase delta subunit
LVIDYSPVAGKLRKMDLSSLLDIVRTEAEKDDLLWRLFAFQEASYRVKKRKKQLKERTFAPSQIEVIESILGRKLELLKPTEVESLAKKVARFFQSLPALKIFLALEPSQALVGKISDWFKAQGIKALLDIQVDRRLIGGVIIEYQGKHLDYSLRRRLQENEGF